MATPRAVEPLDQREQLIDLARRQRRGRLVHHEHRRAVRSRVVSAFAISTICRCARLSRWSGVSGVDVHARDRRAARAVAAVQPPPVDDAGPARRRGAEEDVLGDRQVRDEVQLLVDDADAERERVARASGCRRSRPWMRISPASLR